MRRLLITVQQPYVQRFRKICCYGFFLNPELVTEEKPRCNVVKWKWNGEQTEWLSAKPSGKKDPPEEIKFQKPTFNRKTCCYWYYPWYRTRLCWKFQGSANVGEVRCWDAWVAERIDSLMDRNLVSSSPTARCAWPSCTCSAMFWQR